MGTRAARCGGYWARAGARACWHMACLIGLPHGGRLMASASIDALPAPIAVDTGETALVIIDMQRDFLEPGGFGEMLGNDVSQLRAAIEPCRALLDAGAPQRHAGHPHARGPSPRPDRRAAGQGRARRAVACASATPGPMGRILVRGEPGHDIIPELYPLPGEPVIDKPGKGAFYATDLARDPAATAASSTLLVVRRHHRGLRPHHGARGQRPRLRCIVPGDCCGSYFPEFHEIGPAR